MKECEFSGPEAYSSLHATLDIYSVHSRKIMQLLGHGKG